jgi:RNA polymerase sigma-70 factor, ECF subfamily
MRNMKEAMAQALQPEIDDAMLAQRVQAREPGAFELLMRRHNRRLYRVARAMLRDGAEAEDALQDAYLAAYQAIDSFRGQSTLATWLSKVLVNQCLGRMRRQARRDNIVPIVAMDADEQELHAMPNLDSETPDNAMLRTELRAVLERKLDQLPEAFRTVFVLRCVEELSVEETAQVLDVPEATVRTRLFRARAMLRESLAQDIDVAERDVFAFGGVHCDRIVAAVLGRLGVATPRTA